MKQKFLAGVLVLAFGAGQVMAAAPPPPPCPTTNLLTGIEIKNLLSNKYGCASRGSETWNELHQGTGFGPHNVQDYKRGQNDPVDPSKVVGTYTIADATPGTITYNYGDPDGPYTYVVQRSGDANVPSFLFCNVVKFERFTVGVFAAHC